MGMEAQSDSDSKPTRLELITDAVDRLEAADCSAPRRTAEWFLTEVLGCDRAQLYAYSDAPVESEEMRRFFEMIDRRVDGEPLQHILGYTSFYGLRIRVSPDVMIPRPETEEVVEGAVACIEDVPSPRILDVGTGSGCVALALKHERPDASVFACDVSSAALDVARINATELGLDVDFFEADLSAPPSHSTLPDNLDLLISNPPYIPAPEADSLPPVVREYDPDIALFSGNDPLHYYRALAQWTKSLCPPGAAFVFEVHERYAGEVANFLQTEDVGTVHRAEDLGGRPRIVWGRVS